MTESPEDEFSREEQAFRASFAEPEEFEPLDPAQFVRPSRRKLRWDRVLSAAAAIVVVAGVGFGFSQFAGRGVSATVAEGAPSAAASMTAQDKGELGGGVGQPAPHLPTPGLGSTASAWKLTSQVPLTRIEPATGWLDGRYYLIGGAGACGPSADCKSYRDGVAYDPSTDSWTSIAEPPVSLQGTTGVAFEGKLYFTRATDPTASTLVVYDPSTNSWASIAAPARFNGLVVAGDQLIGVGLGTRLGGDATDRRYDPASNTWTALPTNPFSPNQARSVVSIGDRLVLSAYTLSGETKYATFDLTTQTWTPVTNVTASGRMTAVGGSVVFQKDGSSMLDTYRVADGIGSGLAMDFSQDETDRLKASGLFAANGTVVGSRMVFYGHLLDPSDNSMVPLPDLPKAKLTDQIAIGSPNGLLVYRVTGVDNKAKATAYYLPVSP
ncbi:hypothetical protein ATK74_2895 [Propionicimonas paludicola]|uniref:Kelch motif protein n=1 Tax=Propionicimonas paludicola TaxID=185243 RepID=A0A2A9CVZ0_9ACTN|nr:hypothetical protein [Propionicimonas paludicola]PFG18311.1 hypothetical protein ATK74_2895 [Propionicimonas paludicola]